MIARLGRGGMAEVYRAYHERLDRYVAIKVLHPFLADDPEFKSRFEQEAQNIAKLRHTNIVQVYDFEHDDEHDNYYMVMELIEGETLKDRVVELEQRGETLPYLEALRIIREAAEALAYAHSRGMIHRDVKPANLMIDRDNRVILTDFGIARIVTGGQFTASGGMVGTPAYMAPEQGLGEAGDERSDLYSLGVILFQLLTGKLPYEGENPLSVILMHLNEPTPLVRSISPNLPATVDQVIGKLMAKDPADRYQTADALIEDLRRLERGLALETVELPTAAGGDGGQGVVIDWPEGFAPRDDDTRVIKTASRRRLIPIWLLVFVGAIIIFGGGYFAAVAGGFVQPPEALAFLFGSATPTLTETVSPTATATILPSDTPEAEDTPTATATATTAAPREATDTPTATREATAAVTETPTPTASSTLPPTLTWTPSPTPNLTMTANVRETLTAAACVFDYDLVEEEPLDPLRVRPEERSDLFVPINTNYAREITLLNVGTCAWDVNWSLAFVSGENFTQSRIVVQQRVEVGDTYTLRFEGRTPSAGSVQPIEGVWQLKTRGQLNIGNPLTISILVYDPGS